MVAEPLPATPPRKMERRRHQRVPVSLLGRFMLPTKQEYPCRVLDMSPGGLALEAPVKGNIGDRIIAYLDHVGRVEGEITRHVETGFAMSINAPLRKRDKLAAQLTWLANRQSLGLPEDRRHERMVPKKQSSDLTLPDGRVYRCRVIDISLSGAAVSTDIRPALGSPVSLGKMRGQVVRHIEGGIAIEFAAIQSQELLNQEFFN
jgi:hypothetical protein